MAAETRYRRNGRPKVEGFRLTSCACVRRQQRERQAQAGNVTLFQAAAPPPPPPALPVAPATKNDGRSMTLQPFPAGAGTAMAWQRPPPEMMKAPSLMTIVYGGQVIKVENVPADKGKQLIQMAQSLNNPPAPEKMVVVDDVPDEEPQVVAGPLAAITASQARKLSVQKFLGKRKQRIDDDPDEASPSKKMDAGGDEPFDFWDVPDASWLSL